MREIHGVVALIDRHSRARQDEVQIVIRMPFQKLEGIEVDQFVRLLFEDEAAPFEGGVIARAEHIEKLLPYLRKETERG